MSDIDFVAAIIQGIAEELRSLDVRSRHTPGHVFLYGIKGPPYEHIGTLTVIDGNIEAFMFGGVKQPFELADPSCVEQLQTWLKEFIQNHRNTPAAAIASRGRGSRR